MTATLTLCQSQQFITNAAAGTTLAWAVDSVAGGNATLGTVTSGGLYTAPPAAGVHTITASSVSPAFSATASAAVTDLAAVWTAHNDNGRTSQNLQEYALTPSTVSSGRFHKLWSCTVDGQILAQPLYVAGVTANGAAHNLVIVATHHDSVYAFDADDASCHVIWHTSFLSAGVTPAQSTCHDTYGEYGVQPTPVIDVAAQRLYVLAVTNENGTVVQRLHVLNLVNGQEPVASVPIQATSPGNMSVTFNAAGERPRAGLALANGGVYLSWASFCDASSWQGWLIRYDATSLAQTAVFDAVPNPSSDLPYGGGGIWMSSSAPAIDTGGAMYLSTGNGNFSNTANTPYAPADNYGMAVLKFDTFNPTALNVQSYFVPTQNATWSADDFDVSAVSVTLIPDADSPAGQPLAIGGSKQGNVYVLDQTNLGLFGPVSDTSLQSATMPGLTNCRATPPATVAYNSSCFYSNPAYYDGYVYMGVTVGSLYAFKLTNGRLPVDGSGTLIPSSQTNVPASRPNAPTSDGINFIYPSPNTVISAAPTGGGVAWILDNSNCGYSASCGLVPGPAFLYAYNALDLSQNLFLGSALPSDATAGAIKFQIPTVANGHVYVGGCVTNTDTNTNGVNGGTMPCLDQTGSLTVFGLTP